MIANVIFGILAWLSLLLLLWQWWVARRFPLHRRAQIPKSFHPAITLLKPLKGADSATEDCLRSWFSQEYPGAVQILFGVASAEDRACAVVQRLIAEFPGADARLIVCGALTGANAKVSKLVELMGHAKHELVAVSDADVKVPRDFLANVVLPFQEEKSNVGLVNCFYRLAGLSTLAMQWEAVAINADFWSQVLQAESLRPIDFALGAVMVLRRKDLEGIGGFEALKDCLADDYQLGHRIAGKGKRIALCPLVVECWSEPMFFPAVWKHQLRWARTIRVCQPVPYFFSILSNPTFWPLVWLGVNRGAGGLGTLVLCLVVRIWTSLDLQKLLAGTWVPLRYGWLAPMKDLLHTLIWAQSFAGNSIEWRGERMRLRRDGTLERAGMARG